MQISEESLITEGKEFLKINRRYKQDTYPDAGTIAYLICSKWFKKYKQFICYK